MLEPKPEILYEDPQIIVCVKPAGTPTQSRSVTTPDMVSILKNHLQQETKTANPYLALIHRLDQPVRGLLVFAKTPDAAKELNRQMTYHGFGKYYLALVHGPLPQEEDTLEDYLVKDVNKNMSTICTKDTPGAKLARLSYWKIREEKNNQVLVEIHLETGRLHQIRVQFAHIGCPVVGDTKYNPNAREHGTLYLYAYKLEFTHPETGERMHFQLDPVFQ